MAVAMGLPWTGWVCLDCGSGSASGFYHGNVCRVIRDTAAGTDAVVLGGKRFEKPLGTWQ